MTKEEKEFLEKNFKAGEYAQVTILVKNKDLNRLLETLTNANLTLAVLPSAKANMDFNDPNNKGPTQ